MLLTGRLNAEDVRREGALVEIDTQEHSTPVCSRSTTSREDSRTVGSYSELSENDDE
jgi:hypothetical protein